MSCSRFLAGLSCLVLLAPVASAAAPKCTTGELFAGSPDFDDPWQRAEDGQGLLDVPPLGFRSLLFVGEKLVTAVGHEIWVTDLSADAPVLERFVGREERNARASKPGKCLTARFGNISGIALLPDGSLAGADQEANNIFLVTDPFGPACMVSFIAGATEAQVPLNPGAPAGVGDADGPGASALIRLPDWVATLDDGAIYFIDSGNRKLKRVLPDADHTVETVAALPEGNYFDLMALKGKLYTVANNNSSEGFVLEIDPESGEVRDVERGRADVWQSGGAINLSGLATDGKGIFTTQSGKVLYVTLKGDVKAIAGTDIMAEPSPDYDPHAKHPANELQLWSMRRTPTAGANIFLTYRDGQLYFSAIGTGPYVERIGCK